MQRNPRFEKTQVSGSLFVPALLNLEGMLYAEGGSLEWREVNIGDFRGAMQNSPFKKVAVIGSGVMGSQVAAQIANAGVPVLLLDIVPEDKEDRDFLAKSAVERMEKMSPSPFMHPNNAKLITPGNIEDDLANIADADWILEAVLEDPLVKSDLFKKVDAARRPGSIVSSNTSTIPVAHLIEGQSEQFAQDFLVTHFFNPPRFMRLLEIVAGEKTSPRIVESLSRFCDCHLGKGIVHCKDSPGFIANRLGIFFLQCAVNAAFDGGLTVEEADAVFSKPAGMPKTGVFGLMDLIGLDLIPLIAKSFMATLPSNDAFRKVNMSHPLIEKMIAEGYTGRKGKGGFYRMRKTDEGKVMESVDLKTGDYRPSKKVRPESVEEAGKNLRALCEMPDHIGTYAWIVLSQTLVYAASLVPAIADDCVAVDEAMRLGFNWKYGPFELIDRLGAGWFADRLQAEGRAVPSFLKSAAGRSFYRVQEGKLEFLTVEGAYAPVVRPEGVLLLSDIKLASKPVLENNSASVWDIGDGILCFEFHTKMNAIDDSIFNLLQDTIKFIPESNGAYKGLVIYNEADAFSAGANLGLMLFEMNVSLFDVLSQLIKHGQQAYHALRFAPFPSVAAPSGLALGGGCEIALHCSAVQAHAETYMGLVEFGVGLIPCWGGCTQMIGRAFTANDKGYGGPIPPVFRVFDIISHAKQSTSAFDASELLFLRETDALTMNRSRLLYDAKKRAMEMAKNYTPPKERQLDLPGPAGRAALNVVIEGLHVAGKITAHDVKVSKALAAVLCGGENDFTSPVSETKLMELEHREFLKLEHSPATAARIAHMLKTGKPLRN